MKNIKNLLVLSLAITLFSAVATFAAPKTVKKTLEEQIRSEILSLPDYGVFDIIGFEIDGTTVTLNGKLYNAFNRKSAARRIEKLEGVETVINNIELLPPSGFDDRIRRSALRSFANTGGIYRYLVGLQPSVRIIVERGHLTLVGKVARDSDKKLFNILAQGVPGVFSVSNDLKVNKKY